MAEKLGLYAVFGKPIGHSLSPILHNRAFLQSGRPGHYLPVECAPDELFEKLTAFQQLGGLGVNLTRPLKETIIPHLLERSAWVERSGAANTLYWMGGGWGGDNTDCQALGRRIPPAPAGGAALVLGAGGAARASVAVLEEHGYAVTVAARRVDSFNGASRVIAWSERMNGGPWQVVINATPLGQLAEDRESIWPVPAPGGIAVDWVYRPRETPFLALARQHQAHIVDGLQLLIEQASLAWMPWFGVEGPRDVMWEAVRTWS